MTEISFPAHFPADPAAATVRALDSVRSRSPYYAGCVYTQVTYNSQVQAVFVELPAFELYRPAYLDAAGFARLQQHLMANPEAGDVIEGTGGLRKLRFADVRRGKGKRGGLRVIYYWWTEGPQFWL